MQKYMIITFTLITIFLLIYIIRDKLATETMQYFPIADNAQIDIASTKISYCEKTDKLCWQVQSSSSVEAYLRQDVSLLYENGKFKAVLNKWKQQVSQLDSTKKVSIDHNSFLQAISFHHGEIHSSNNQINSIQQMTNAHLYYINEDGKSRTFTKPNTKYETAWQKKLHKMTEEQLLAHWNQLMTHLQIEKEDYHFIPLTELYKYDEQTLPNRSKEETEQIIGQLWEGLYKNYLLLLLQEKTDANHYIPLILFAKDNSHLLVIFELNEKEQKLIQMLP